MRDKEVFLALQRCVFVLLVSIFVVGCKASTVSYYDDSGISCEPTVQGQLDALALSSTDVKKISMVPRRRNIFDSEVLVGFDAWVGLQACRGYLIVDMNATCKVRQVYTRGQCKLAGVKNFR